MRLLFGAHLTAKCAVADDVMLNGVGINGNRGESDPMDGCLLVLECLSSWVGEGDVLDAHVLRP